MHKKAVGQSKIEYRARLLLLYRKAIKQYTITSRLRLSSS
jgi:hypothetical protein